MLLRLGEAIPPATVKGGISCLSPCVCVCMCVCVCVCVYVVFLTSAGGILPLWVGPLWVGPLQVEAASSFPLPLAFFSLPITPSDKQYTHTHTHTHHKMKTRRISNFHYFLMCELKAPLHRLPVHLVGEVGETHIPLQVLL